MKTTLHPQLLAALAISAGIFTMHTRGFADTPHPAGAVQAFQAPTVVAMSPLQTVSANRDPFVAAIDESSAMHAPVAAVGLRDLPDEKAPPATASDAKNGLHLRAVVLGTRRYALMAEGSSSRIVTVGSPLAGSSVKEISLGGIVLANGARFIPEETVTK